MACMGSLSLYLTGELFSAVTRGLSSVLWVRTGLMQPVGLGIHLVIPCYRVAGFSPELGPGMGSGRRGRNRTCNPQIRNLMLYPIELRAREKNLSRRRWYDHALLPDLIQTLPCGRSGSRFPKSD